MERKRPSKSQDKEHSSKKNVERTSKQTENSEGKSHKRILSSEDTSSADESRIQHAQLNSCTTNRESSSKGADRNLEIGRIRPSTSKLLEKEHSLMKNVEESSRRKGGKAYKRIASFEERVSGGLVNAGLHRTQAYHIHSRAFSEDSHKKARRKIERKRPSSSKLPEKPCSVEKNAEETSRRTQSRRKTYKRINYYEDSSPDESVNDVTSPIRLDSRASGENNRHKEAPGSLDTVLNNNKIEESCDSDFEANFVDVCNESFESHKSDDMTDAKRFLLESSDSETLLDRRDFSRSGSFSPFRFWGKKTSSKRHSKSDDECQRDGTEVQDAECARKAPKPVNKDTVEKEWEKYKARIINKDKKKGLSASKFDGSEAGTSSKYEWEGTLKSNMPVISSEVDMEGKDNSTKIEDDASAEIAPKVESNDNVKKESEKFKVPRKNLENKELSSPKIPDADPGFRNRWMNAFKSIKPKMHAEGNVGHRKGGTEVENDASARNSLKVVSNDDGMKVSERFKSPRKQLYNKKPSSYKIGDTESGTTSSINERENAFKFVTPTINSEVDTEHRTGRTEDVPKVVNKVKKESEKFKVSSRQLESKESSNKKMNDSETGTFASFCHPNEDNKPIKLTFKRLRYSEGEMEHRRDGTEMDNGICARNASKLANNDSVKKEGEKSLQKLEKKKEQIRYKVDDAQDADKVPNCESSNENLADQESSPITVENKRGLKRLSDPSNVLKENRPPPSI